MAYNASSARTAMERVAAALGATDAPSAVFDLVTGAGGPTALRDLGLPESDLDRAAAEAASMTYPNPAAVTAGGLRGLLADAWRGAPPAPTV
jgi:alcohol dehydrogenase class IV